MAKNKPNKWTSRIVGHDKVRADQLLANPGNHRKHPQKQREVVAASIEELGFCKSVIVNRRTGHIVDGHERVMQALGVSDDTMVDVEYVDLSESDERKLLLILDASTGLAEVDTNQLDELIKTVDTNSKELTQWFDELSQSAHLEDEDENKEIYTRKIEAPIYRPRGEKPKISDLYADERYRSLVEKIDAAKIPEAEKAFLKVAATRHVVFNYENIAEFYAHSSAEAQRLMEDSALVVIDYDRAVELGYVELSKQLSELFESEHTDEE